MPNHAKFCHPATKSVRDIRVKNLCSPKKVDLSSSKSLKTSNTPIPVIMINFIIVGQTVYKKSVTKFFYTLHHFGAPGDPLGQSSPGWVVTYSKTLLSSCQILTPPDNPSTRYLLPKFDFVDGVTDTKKQTVNDVVSAYHAVTIIYIA